MKLQGNGWCVLLVAVGVVMWLGPAGAFGAVPDNIRMLVPKNDAGGTTGTNASYTYDPTNNVFWMVVYGTGKGIRRYDVGTATSVALVGDTDFQLFALSRDVPAGTVSSNDTGSPICFAILLNPQPLTVSVRDPNHPTDPNYTISINYPAGTLAFIDQTTVVKEAGLTNRPEWTKYIFRYDLRTIGNPTSAQPDYNTAGNGAGGVTGAFGVVDWNDCFTVAATMANWYSAAGVSSGTPNIGRQFAWSTDGAYLYCVDISSSTPSTAGLFKMSAATGALARIYNTTSSSSLRLGSEPAVIPSSLRNLGAGSGDQILIDGTTGTGNTGGINFLVDNAGTVTGPNSVVSGATLAQFMELDPNVYANIVSLASDASGNIYYADSASYTYAVYEYDTLARLACIKNKAQEYAFDVAQGGTGALAGSNLRLQTRDANHPTAGVITEVMYRGNNKYIAGIWAFRPGDFTRDGVIDANDTNFFINQIKISQGANGDPNKLPWGASDPNFLNYINADLNGNAMPNSGRTALSKIAVTDKDRLVMLQFANLWEGDVNWDGTVDANDRAAVVANIGKSNPLWFDGDLNGDGVVDANDLTLLDAQLGAVYTIDPGANAMGGYLRGYLLDLVVNHSNWGSVTLDPAPGNPNVLLYPQGSVVTLTAVPISGKSLKEWTIYDPNHPGDLSYAVNDANNPITITMDSARQVDVDFKCGSGMEYVLPLAAAMLPLFGVVTRRRAGR
jgi:hypothetical protein